VGITAGSREVPGKRPVRRDIHIITITTRLSGKIKSIALLEVVTDTRNCKWYWQRFPSKYCSFPLIVSFHQYFVLFFTLRVFLSEGEAGGLRTFE
jgi:hypothetical protein